MGKRSMCPKAAVALFGKGFKGAEKKGKQEEMQGRQDPRPDVTIMNSRGKAWIDRGSRWEFFSIL